VQIITLGIGPDSDIEHLVLTGLAAGSSPPPPTPSGGGSLNPGTPAILTENITYVLPARLVRVTAIVPGGAAIQISLDATTWQNVTLDSNKTFITSAPFIRSIGHDSVVVAKVFPL